MPPGTSTARTRWLPGDLASIRTGCASTRWSLSEERMMNAPGVLAVVGLAAGVLSTWAVGQKPTPQSPPPEVVVYASDLPKSALSEFDVWNDPAAPGGRMVGLPNNGDGLDPPPENDPHVTFKVKVQHGIPSRCWIHMKVGAPKGKSQANVLWVQFSDAVDKANGE